MSKIIEKVIEVLSRCKMSSDVALAEELDLEKQQLQQIIFRINNYRGRRYSSCKIIRYGKIGNLMRELVKTNTDENSGLDNRDRYNKKAIKSIERGKNLGEVLKVTRNSIESQNLLMNRILRQNLDTSIKIQQLISN